MGEVMYCDFSTVKATHLLKGKKMQITSDIVILLPLHL